jgi:predicted ferric reductase
MVTPRGFTGLRNGLIWAVLLTALAVPIVAAMNSPLLAWRDPIYIAAGLAGVLAMALLLVQPLLAAGVLPGLSGQTGRRMHRWVGGGLVALVIVHVAALWMTSPPDVIDALLFVSPTPFSVWGVIAMWAVFAAALIAIWRHRMKLPPRTWRRIHTMLTTVVIAGSVIHALLIEGTMETLSKIALCALVVAAAIKAFSDLRIWKLWWPLRRQEG